MLGVVSGSMFKECTVAATYAASPTLTLALKATSDFKKKNDVTAGGALTLSKTLSAKAKFGMDSIEAVASNKLAAVRPLPPPTPFRPTALSVVLRARTRAHARLALGVDRD